MNTVILPVMGFTQSTRRVTGLERLWRQLRGISSPDTLVCTPVPWNSDAEAVAALIHRNARPYADVFVFAYSWGAGAFFQNFCRAMGDRGRLIDHALLIDPVYHSRLLSFRWLALTPWPKLEIEPNVRRVTWFFQRQNRPSGHRPVVAGGSSASLTVIKEGTELRCRHEDCDDAKEVHDAALKIAGVI